MRIKTLSQLIDAPLPFILITTVSALPWKILAKNELSAAKISIKKGVRLRRDVLIEKLLDFGFQAVGKVESFGEFSYKGDSVIFFPPEFQNPVRVDFFGDEVEKIRLFNLESYHTVSLLSEMELFPISESFFKGDSREVLINKISDRGLELGLDHYSIENIIEEIDSGKSFEFKEFVFPFFHDVTDLFDYIPKNSYIYDLTKKKTNKVLENIVVEYNRALSNQAVLPEKEDIFLSYNYLNDKLSRYESVTNNIIIYDIAQSLKSFLPVTSENENNFKNKVNSLIEDGETIFFCFFNNWEKSKLIELFPEIKFISNDFVTFFSESSNIYGFKADLSVGGYIPEDKIIVIGREQWINTKIFHVKKTSRSHKKIRLSLSDINIGDFVVHEDHGIAKYQGVVYREKEGDFVLLQFANGKVYLSIFVLNKISPFLGNTEPKLSYLGSDKWKKEKEKVKNSMEELAAELLKLYAVREKIKGFSYSPPGVIYNEVSDNFPFQETVDQQKAIDEVIEDMTDTSPMDRLICGDAGFGKTEVALRAAVKAVEDGKQVAFLVPTTVLSLQHFQYFKKRLYNSGIEVENLSRLTAGGKMKKILERMSDGKIDIAIGTQRLLSKDVVFNELGLIIIDEEQKFGVRQKEKLRKIVTNVDTLFLTATPIPRTLDISLAGLRKISVLTIPPKDRKEIQTFVIDVDFEKIKKGIERELRRNGQVLIIYNKIENMEEFFFDIKKIVPKQTDMTFVHAKMDNNELEERILGFYNGKYSILISTTIVESGIDIPNVNTIFIFNAQNFGLAELYQLRGRVGRSDKVGFTYLVIPGEKKLTEKAKKRIDVIKSFASLGSGFKVALKDLEIRGSGEFLGKKQSGNINSLGYDLYMKLLNKTILRMKNEEVVFEDIEIKVGIDAFFPIDYIEVIEERLDFYYQLSSFDNVADINKMANILFELYGEPEEEVKNLLEINKIRVLLNKIGVDKLVISTESVSVYPSSNSLITPEIALLLSSKYNNIKLTPSNISWQCDNCNWEQLSDIYKILSGVIKTNEKIS